MSLRRSSEHSGPVSSQPGGLTQRQWRAGVGGSSVADLIEDMLLGWIPGEACQRELGRVSELVHCELPHQPDLARVRVAGWWFVGTSGHAAARHEGARAA